MENRRKWAGRSRTRRGFTLVEIMVVVVIIGLLATLVGPNVYRQLFRGTIQAAKSDIRNIESAVDFYRTRHFRLPESIEDLILPDEEGETYLRNLTEVPKDPWGNEYVLEEDPDRKGGFIIRSFGPDGEAYTDDDITNLNMREVRS